MRLHEHAGIVVSGSQATQLPSGTSPWAARLSSARHLLAAARLTAARLTAARLHARGKTHPLLACYGFVNGSGPGVAF